MSIDKLNMQDLSDGINSLKLWYDAHEKMLDKLELVKDKLEENEGSSIQRALDAIEDFENSIRKRSHEIKKKHKEVLKYKNKLKDTGVKPTNSEAYIFISNGDELKRKIKSLLDDAVDNKRISVDEANKSAISWWIEKEDKEDLEYYIDQRNSTLRNMESYLENKYSEIEDLMQSAFDEVKKLEKMEDIDLNFSLSHYNITKKMMEIKINISKVKVTKEIDFLNESTVKRLNTAKEKGFEFVSWNDFKEYLKKIKKSMLEDYSSVKTPYLLLKDWFDSWYLVIKREMKSPSGYGELSTYEYLQLVAYENGYPPEILISIISKEQYTKFPPDWGINFLEFTNILDTGHSMGLGAMNVNTAITSLQYSNPELLDLTLLDMGIPYTSKNINYKNLTYDEKNIFENYLHSNNGFNIDCINATLHYYNDEGSPGVIEKDAKDMSSIHIDSTTKEKIGVVDGSIKPINISNWDNLSYEEKVESIGRYNANDTEKKNKYGSIVVDAIDLIKH